MRCAIARQRLALPTKHRSRSAASSVVRHFTSTGLADAAMFHVMPHLGNCRMSAAPPGASAGVDGLPVASAPSSLRRCGCGVDRTFSGSPRCKSKCLAFAFAWSAVASSTVIPQMGLSSYSFKVQRRVDHHVYRATLTGFLFSHIRIASDNAYDEVNAYQSQPNRILWLNHILDSIEKRQAPPALWIRPHFPPTNRSQSHFIIHKLKGKRMRMLCADRKLMAKLNQMGGTNRRSSCNSPCVSQPTRLRRDSGLVNKRAKRRSSPKCRQ